jgi:hypothetical protein
MPRTAAAAAGAPARAPGSCGAAAATSAGAKPLNLVACVADGRTREVMGSLARASLVRSE